MTPSHCLIATATYGSELSPEVQLLRNFRDNSLAKSYLGSSFLIIFNAWYYSFSPNVAQYLDTHVIPRYLMRVVLYPSIQFFRVASQLYAELHVYPELATVVSGTVASFLLGAFYIGIPLGLITRKLNRKLSIKIWYFILLCGLSTILLGEMLTSAFLLMISSSITVLATVFASAISTATLISKRSLKIKNKHEYADPT